MRVCVACACVHMQVSLAPVQVPVEGQKSKRKLTHHRGGGSATKSTTDAGGEAQQQAPNDDAAATATATGGAHTTHAAHAGGAGGAKARPRSPVDIIAKKDFLEEDIGEWWEGGTSTSASTSASTSTTGASMIVGPQAEHVGDVISSGSAASSAARAMSEAGPIAAALALREQVLYALT